MIPAASKTDGRRALDLFDVFTVPDAHVRLRLVVAVTGLSESTIRRRIAAGAFPAPIRHGARCTRWKVADVAAWLRQQS